MRTLKIILILLGALVLLGVILVALAEPRYRVERSIVVHAPAAAVYANLSNLAAMDKWGPWKEEEPDMVATISGAADGQVGAISHWTSSKSEGEQELVELVPDQRVRTKLRFMKPFASESAGTFDLEAMGDSTRVTWGMEGENGIPGRLFSLFMDMDKAIGSMFEKGLANLKAITEKEHADAASAFPIQAIDRPAMLYIGTRKLVKWSEMKAFFTEQFSAGMAALGKSGLAPAGAPTAIYFEWNEADQTADMIAGIPAPMEAKSRLKGVDLYETPASRALIIDYTGGYAGIGKAHEALDAHMKAANLEFNANVLEEYITDPGSTPDSAQWHTNVVYLVK